MSELSCFSLRVWTESSMPLLLDWDCKAPHLGAPAASEFSAIAGLPRPYPVSQSNYLTLYIYSFCALCFLEERGQVIWEKGEHPGTMAQLTVGSAGGPGFLRKQTKQTRQLPPPRFCLDISG